MGISIQGRYVGEVIDTGLALMKAGLAMWPENYVYATLVLQN